MGLSRAGSSAFAARLFARGTPPALALLKAAWPAAVGPELARRTEVLALEGTALRVRVPDVRWRKVLHRMQPEILARLRRVAGELAPRRLGFSEGGPLPQTTEAGFTPAEGLDDARGGARTPRREGVFRSGAFPQTTEAGFTPAEGLDDARGGARTPRREGVFRSGALPQTTEAGFTPAEGLDDGKGGARTPRREGVFRSGAFPQTTEAGFTPAEGLDDGKGGARTPREDAAPELPESVAAAACAIDDPEIRARFERSAARYLGAFRR